MEKNYSFNEFKYMRMIMSELQRQMETELEKLSAKHSLSKPLLFSHNWILQCLYYAEKPLSLTEITKRAGLSLPNVSVGMNTLIELGIAQQIENSSNKRIRCMYLTDFGRSVCDDYLENHLPIICQHLYRGVSREQFSAVHEFYLQIAQNIGVDSDE